MKSTAKHADGPPIVDGARQRVTNLLRDNGHLFRQALRKRLRELPVTPAEARALMYLRGDEGVAQARLAEDLEVQPIALTRTLDRLEQAGLVERRLSGTDRRLRLIFPTATGTAMIQRLFQLHDELNSQITLNLSDDEIRRLAATLETLNAALGALK
jgi:MarR family transcriptional regulator, transcriptional regulator for hemolysin